MRHNARYQYHGSLAVEGINFSLSSYYEVGERSPLTLRVCESEDFEALISYSPLLALKFRKYSAVVLDRRNI